MGSASKMEITFYTEFILSPGFSTQKKWIISEVVHTNTTIFTSSRKIGAKYFNIFFGTDLRSGFPEQMAFKTEKNRFRQGGLLQKVCSSMILAGKPTAQPVEKFM